MSKVSFIENEFVSPYTTPEDLLLNPTFLGAETFLSADLIVGVGFLAWVVLVGFSHLAWMRLARPLFLN